MPTGPAPSPYDLHNRLVRAEAGLRAVEKALEALFKRLNVNRRRDPELDAVLEALAAIRHGLDHARGDRSHELHPEPQACEMGLRFEEEMPAITPLGRATRLRLVTTDADGSERDGGTLDVPDED